MPVRRELGVRTIFNFLGPLTNPAGARRQLVGVSDARYLETIAGALARLGSERALVVAGEDGLDEVSASAPTRIVEVDGGELRAYTVTPAGLGVDAGGGPADAGGLEGGTPERNAAVTRAVLAGERGPAREVSLANAGAAIYAAGAAASIADGVEAARAAVDDGRAAATLERFVGRRSARAVSILDEILATTREDVARRRAELPRGGARARGGPHRGRVPRRPRRPRARDHRRAQAPLAVGGSDPARLERRNGGSPRSRAPTPAAAPPRCRC